jgi:hypothetical protein
LHCFNGICPIARRSQLVNHTSISNQDITWHTGRVHVFFSAFYIGRIAGEHDIVGIVMPRCGSVYDIFIHVGWMDGRLHEDIACSIT